jgi:hypothetical protein
MNPHPKAMPRLFGCFGFDLAGLSSVDLLCWNKLSRSCAAGLLGDLAKHQNQDRSSPERSNRINHNKQ